MAFKRLDPVAPGAWLDGTMVPVLSDVTRAGIEHAVQRCNGAGMRGRSDCQAIKTGPADRQRRQPTRRQRSCYLAGPIPAPVEGDRRGQVKPDGRTCGASGTHTDLSAFHQSGQTILSGRGPDDFSAGTEGNEGDTLVPACSEPMARGACGTVDGVRDLGPQLKIAGSGFRRGRGVRRSHTAGCEPSARASRMIDRDERTSSRAMPKETIRSGQARMVAEAVPGPEE